MEALWSVIVLTWYSLLQLFILSFHFSCLSRFGPFLSPVSLHSVEHFWRFHDLSALSLILLDLVGYFVLCFASSCINRQEADDMSHSNGMLVT